MLRPLLAATALAGLSAFSPAGAQMQTAPPPVEAYAALPYFQNIDISPSGKYILARMRGAEDDAYKLVILENTGSSVEYVYGFAETDEFTVSNPFWKSDDIFVFSVRFGGERYRTETVETRLFAFSIEDLGAYPLFPRYRRDEIPVQIQNNIVSYLPDDPDHILIEYGGYDQTVYQVDVTAKGGRHKRVQGARSNVLTWDADDQGNVRAGWGLQNDKIPQQIIRTIDGKWQDVDHRVADGLTFDIAGFAADGRHAFVLSDHETDTTALYRYDIETDTFVEQLYNNPDSDIFGIVRNRETGEVMGVRVGDQENVETEWFEESLSDQAKRELEEMFPGRRADIYSFNLTDEYAVAELTSGNRPGQRVIYNLVENRPLVLPSQYPALDNVATGAIAITKYTARDGLEIPAYVTLPLGMTSFSELKDVPFVVLPHGGPSAREFATFDWWTQFLSSRGYGVLQMNFRGSSGFGSEFQDAGKRQWGQAMQDDITDGTHWLIERGFADPDRIAIMGASYGGYATLMGAAKEPDLYQCALTHGAVADLRDLLSHWNDFIGGEYGSRHVGRLWQDRAMLRDNSPTQLADNITIPVLMFHGEEDRVVPVDQSRKMARTMERAGKDITYVELPAGNHYLSVGVNRLTFLTEMEKFLAEDCFGD